MSQKEDVMTDETPSVALTAATKVYGSADAEVRALDDVTIAFPRGQFTAVMGPSGSGKSTLLNCMAGLDRLTSGTVEIGGVDLRDLSDRDLTILRRTRLGFIFQSFNLLPALTARENITYPLDLSRSRVDPQWFDELIGVLGLRDRLDNRPSQLSGGQQQRVAVARALVSKPEVVFADEPTGSLDSHTSGEILSHLRKASDLGQTIVMVTHDPYAAAHTHNVVFFQDGAPVGELASPTADGVLDRMKSLGADR
ncbi:MAG TPA: ABC transporter ATP-binding protein [Microthrixaceae bacterium]|jgi:putative ABC transport system ATP-binding protein|nr:ABC transporter ATP-binding protein [Microthrixaceae bacterium]HNJ70495.1 ABC transporter ATP-binding protein [Microthrixaceae bacterium]